MKELEKTYKCRSCGKVFAMRPVKDDPWPVPCIYCTGTADLLFSNSETDINDR